jgi:hypothetical protein
MSWICRKCETENSDALDVCEVCNSVKEIYIRKQPISFTTRYYIAERQGSYLGGDLVMLDLPRGTLVRKMLTDEWIPIEAIEIAKPHLSDTSYYYAWGLKGVYKIAQLRSMHLSKNHLIREMLTERWFPIGE